MGESRDMPRNDSVFGFLSWFDKRGKMRVKATRSEVEHYTLFCHISFSDDLKMIRSWTKDD